MSQRKKSLNGTGTIYSALEEGEPGHITFLSQNNLINLHDCFSSKT